MNAALRTLTAATIRARRSAPAQACTAENAGTMNNPPAMASPARSIATRNPRADLKTSAKPAVAVVVTSHVAQLRSSANSPSSTAASSVGNRTMRPCASHDASAEPTPIATAKTAKNAVMTLSSPPSTFFTSGGRSERAIAPTSQNQLVTKPPHHNRGSAFRAPSKRKVERTMLKSSLRSGAACPVGGIRRAEIQHASANTIITLANEAWFGPSLAASPPAIVPSRIAMKVALSIRALPAGSSERAR